MEITLFLRIGVIFGREKFYFTLYGINTTQQINIIIHTHKKRYLAVISHSTRFKEFNRKKTSNKNRIGNISVNSTACADDIALISEEQDQTQILINMAYDYAYMEGYVLQPTKSGRPKHHPQTV